MIISGETRLSHLMLYLLGREEILVVKGSIMSGLGVEVYHQGQKKFPYEWAFIPIRKWAW